MAALALEELAAKIDQTLAAAAAAQAQGRASGDAGPKGGPARARRVPVRMKDGTQQDVELTADLCLGIGDDPDKLAKQLRSQGLEVQAVEVPRRLQPKEVVQWSESLNQSFTKAWIQKADAAYFIENACRCGEGLIRHDQPDFAYCELYCRYADRMLMLRSGEAPSEVDDTRRAGVAVRFYLGRCMALYQRTIQRDTMATRRDTVDSLRDVLLDLLEAMKYLNSFPSRVREDLYWAVYNACLLALRLARWLRLQGFGGLCVQPLLWLAECMNTCAPFTSAHVQPFRIRFLEELIYCLESAQKLDEAAALCDQAIEQLQSAMKAEENKLEPPPPPEAEPEVKPPDPKDAKKAAAAKKEAGKKAQEAPPVEEKPSPLPKEALEVFETGKRRFKMLKIKYDLWLGKVAEAGQAAALAEDLGGSTSRAVPCLLEALGIQHGLPERFGVQDGSPKEAVLEAEEAEGVTRLGFSQIWERQADIIGAIVAAVKPHMESLEAAAKALEDHTKARLAYEEEAERRASDEFDGDAPEPTPPSAPDEEKLQSLGFSAEARRHAIEDALPLAAHVALAKECLRHELLDTCSEKVRGSFQLVERSLALRLRYRHFLWPPLVDLDVIVVPERDRSKVKLPEKYDFLSEDLNATSPINAEIYARPPPKTPYVKDNGPKPKHVFVIGKRFNAWDSWSPTFPHAAAKRICNLRVVFANQLPAPKGTPTFGMQHPKTLDIDGSLLKPWLEPYQAACAADGAGFDHAGEAEQTRELLLQQLVEQHLLRQEGLALPLDLHPQAVARGRKAPPMLVFDVYDEAALWEFDAAAAGGAASGATQQRTLHPDALEEAPAEEQQPAEESDQVLPGLNSEAIVPPWCPLLDKAQVASTTVVDLSIFLTGCTYASPPAAKFNALIRTDLRRTPDSSFGSESQSYAFVSVAVDAPSIVFVSSRLRVLRALHALHLATVEAAEDAAAEAGESGVAEGQQPKHAVLDRLLEFAECLERVAAGECGRLFLLDAADLLEDVCAHVFLSWVWPQLRTMQDRWQQHELGERVISEAERVELTEWSVVLRRVLPLLLTALGQVQAIDGMTLAGAAYAFSRLQLQAHEKRSGKAELARAIERLERDLATTTSPGPRAALELPVSACVSFDPPSLRPPSHALFDEEGEAATLILQPLPRLMQDRLCMLTRLYASWIDLSLRAHLKGAGTSVKRAAAPGDPHEHLAILEAGISKRLALSNPEAVLLSRLGENPYLRCFFFLAVARRRPEAASQALGKACEEVEKAVAQELELWAFCEKELDRQQQVLRNGEEFEARFRKKQASTGKKLQAHPPLPFSRSPGAIRLRTPPLLGSQVPPRMASSVELEVPAQEYSETQHSERLQRQQRGKLAMACSVFGKATGTGTSVSEQHCDLRGTGVRRPGFDSVEITGIRPNTNYSFAALYYEGFDTLRPAMSSVSETSAAIGSYYPLPVALLRAEICKVALAAGEAGVDAFKKTWPVLFGNFCERATPAEELDSCGLRAWKLRLDVVDRLPPAVLTAFAELILLKNSPTAGTASKAFPCTRQLQLGVLRSANECMLAVDCARRACDANACLRGISFTLHMVARLLQLRTKPHPLLSMLMKCSSALEAFQPAECRVAWYAESRVMAMSLIHYITLMGVQLRQTEVLQQVFAADLPERYAPDALCDPRARARTEARVLDQALELALLGADGWAFAEAKAKVALGGHSSAEELLRLLKALSDCDYAAVVRDAAALVLQDEAARHPFALSLLLCAAGRSWEKGGIAEPLSEVLGKHPSAALLEQLLASAGGRLSGHGFVLRALPPVRLQELEAKEAAAKEAEAEASLGAEPPQEGEAAADQAVGPEDGGAPPPDPAAELERHPDTAALAQLELFQAGPLLSELCGLRFHRRDIANFRFLDLQQVTVPELQAEEMPPEEGVSPDAGAVDAAAPASQTPQADDADGQPEREVKEWERHASEDRQSRQKAFDLLRRLLRRLARAGAYANSTRADRLLQRVLTTALNGLLIAEPRPEECVPPGVKGDPKDLDADRFVGADLFPEETKVEEPPPPEPEDPKAKKGKDAKDKKGKEPAPAEEIAEAPAEPETNDLWLSLALLADQAVLGLGRLRNGEAAPEAPAVDDHGTGNEEVAHIRRAEEIARTLERAGGAESDPWWEKVPDLDITSIAKLIAFTLQCMYHMRRWETVLRLARSFNDVTCSAFATSFLPITVGAQREVVKLASGALANTERYLSTSKEEFEVAQKAIPKKVMRQLALTGQPSEPEKLWVSRQKYYGTMLKRQTDFHAAFDRLLGCFEATSTRAIKGVPAEVEQLRKSRIVLGELLRDRQALALGLRDGSVSEAERPLRERALRLAAVALTSSYRKAVDMFRKRQIYDQVVHALHELGNLQWLEGDAAGAQSSWSDGVDTAFQHVYVIKNWQACAVEPPQDWARAEVMLLALVLLAKHARLATPQDVTSHLDVALFASNVVEALLTTSLPHPSKRSGLSPDSYRLREIFYGLRESRAVLPPNSVYGGVDSPTFLGALAFFHNTLLSTEYQQARCVPICALYNYIATEVCRDRNLALKGRLMMARGLIRCRSLSSAWTAMYTASRNHDRPRSLLGNEDLDCMVAEAVEANGLSPYRVHEEPFTEANVAAAASLLEFEMATGDAPVEEDGAQAQADPKAKAKAKADPKADPKAKAKAKADPKSGKVELDQEPPGPVPAGTPEHHFRFLQAEFLLCVCRYGHVSSHPVDVGSKQQKEWLERVDDILSDLWRDVTGNEDDADAWALQVSSAQAEPAQPPAMATPINILNEETAELCVEVRLLRADGWELRGDTARAVREVLYAMHFLQLLARPPEAGHAGARYRVHPGAQLWGRLRRRMVHLLVAQGRHGAALSHIEQGLKECQAAHDEMTRVDLLATRARLDILAGRFLELRGDGRFGAVPTLQGCLEIARKALPLATPSSVRARMMLCSLLEQNPTLADMGESDGLPASHKGDLEPLDARKREAEPEDPHEEMNLQAQGKIIISPIAKELRTRTGKPPPDTLAQAAVGRQRHLAALMRSCLDELDALLAVEECDLNPPNLNGMQQIGEPGSRERPPLKTLPPRDSSCLREQATSDSREPPNMYSDLMPLRLHCGLRLASLQLRLGELDAAGELLREAEVRLTRCANLLPWLFVQFCVLKLQWRRLARPGGPPPADAANAVWYRDETAFADGVCPPTRSPLFRTFLKRARVPLQIEEGEWRPRAQPPVAGSEEALQAFLQEVAAAMQIGIYEGGHDVAQLASLAREGLEEVLAVKKFQPGGPPEHAVEAAADGEGGGEAATEAQDASSSAKSQAYDAVHAFLCCLVALAESRKALRFRDPLAPEEPAAVEKGGKDAKGGKKDAVAAGPGVVDVSALPLRAALDIQRHVKRQPFEGGLAYSDAAQKELEKSVPFKTVVKHIEAIQQECATFDSLFHDERRLCDRLHVALARASDAYAKAKVLDAEKLKALESPPQIVAGGHTLVHWMQPDVIVPEPGVYDLPPSECCEFLLLVCPLGEDPEAAASEPFVARCPDVPRGALRQLADGLASDLAHCRPAAAVSSEYVEQRLRSVASVLRGARLGGVEAKEIVSKQAGPALKELLRFLATPSAAAEEPAVTTKKSGKPDPKDPKKAPTPGQSRPTTASPEQLEEGMLDSGSVQGLLEALVRLLDVGAAASRVAHPELGRFLQAVLAPLRLAPACPAPA